MSDKRACAVVNTQLHRQERIVASKLVRNPKDVRLRSKLATIKKQIVAERTKCMAEARRERQVRNAEARAERQKFQSERRQAREEARRSKLQTSRERFELRQARREAGETTGEDIIKYGGIAALGIGGIWLARMFL